SHERVRAEVTSWLEARPGGRESGDRVLGVGDDLNFSVWVEDGAAVLVGEDGPRFVRPGDQGRFGDWLLPELVSDPLHLPPPRTAPFSFQGGNLLVGDDFCFLGLDSANRTYTQPTRVLRDRGDRASQIASQLRRHLAGEKSIYLIGTEEVLPPEEQL